jgi:hypothetical protein
MQSTADVDTLKRTITDEIVQFLGLPGTGWARRTLEPIFGAATRRFSEFAAGFDRCVSQSGLREAARWALPRFVKKVEVQGVENIPEQGPLVVAANHPGTVDGLVIAANLPRPDLKILASGMPFIRSLPATARHLIYVTRPPAMYARMNAIRAAIRHLKEGGALLIFPGGNVEPDPGILPGAERAVENWSASLEIFLRSVPQARVLVTIVSNVLSASWMRSPLTRLRKELRDRQKLAEIFQVIQQMIFPRSLLLTPSVHFAELLNPPEMEMENDPGGILQGIITRAKEMLSDRTALALPPRVGRNYP